MTDDIHDGLLAAAGTQEETLQPTARVVTMLADVWFGFCGGVVGGILIDDWLIGNPARRWWIQFIILPAVLPLAFLPRLMVSLVRGIGRYRAASRRERCTERN